MLEYIVFFGLLVLFLGAIIYMVRFENKLTNQVILGNEENFGLRQELAEAEDRFVRLALDYTNQGDALQAWISSALFDAMTIRNLTTSVEALSHELDEQLIARAKVALDDAGVRFTSLPLDEV